MTSFPSGNTKQLNLRYKSISHELLNSSTLDGIDKLLIGPFSHHNSNSVSPAEFVSSLPPSVHHLDWDLTRSSSSSDSSSNNKDECLLPDEVWKELLLERTHVRHLCLRFRGDNGALELSKYLMMGGGGETYGGSSCNHHHLESLDLRGNHITDVGARALATALTTSSTSLRSLNLGYNRIGDEGIEALSSCLLRCSDDDDHPSSHTTTTTTSTSSLEYLNLSCNTFGPIGASYLACALRKNRVLKELSLFCNNIGHASCIELVHVLEYSNYTLQKLKLGGTFTDASCTVRCRMEYFLKLNQYGRVQLRLDHYRHDHDDHNNHNQLSQSSRRLQEQQQQQTWLTILANANNDLDVLNYFVSNKPDLIVAATATAAARHC